MLTETQQDTLNYFADYQRANHRLPTIREIQDHFGLSSTSVAANRIRSLEKCGQVIRLPEDIGKSRGYRLTNYPLPAALPDDLRQRVTTALGESWTMSDPDDKAAAVDAVLQALADIPQQRSVKHKRLKKTSKPTIPQSEYAAVPAKWTFVIDEMQDICWEIATDVEIVGTEPPLVLMQRKAMPSTQTNL